LIEVLNSECVEVLSDLLELLVDDLIIPRHPFALTTLQKKLVLPMRDAFIPTAVSYKEVHVVQRC
jgi:hypothetical protein